MTVNGSRESHTASASRSINMAISILALLNMVKSVERQLLCSDKMDCTMKEESRTASKRVKEFKNCPMAMFTLVIFHRENSMEKVYIDGIMEAFLKEFSQRAKGKAKAFGNLIMEISLKESILMI